MNYKGRTRPNRIKPVGYYVYAYLHRYDYLPYYIGKGKEIEKQYDDEDTAMLMKVIEIRKGLWT